MTEDEAKTKRCCGPVIVPGQARNCIGSACMAWRYEKKPNPEWKSSEGFYITYPPRDSRYDPPMYIIDETQGHCGLAG